MDAKLAQVYGTNQADETDVEALATAALAEKLAAADEVNVDGMSDEEAEALASQILDGDSKEEPPAEDDKAEDEGAEGEEKTAGEKETTPEQEKVAEADYLGRVMAHAYVQERKSIEASEKTASTKTASTKVAGKGKVMEHLKEGKKKKASAEGEEQKLSALDQLAQARALEILKENGIDPNAEAPAEDTEKKSSVDDEKIALLQEKVNERAAAMLVEAGYKFEEKTEENKE